MMKGVSEMGQTDKQFDAQLIDEYSRLKRLREIARTENATETEKAINEEMNLIKLKLQPTKLPD